jgi:hypothetical protein
MRWQAPGEDGVAAYTRGDYVPAIHLFRPLAEAGNPKAAKAKIGLRDASRKMTPAEMSQAQQMAQACEASNSRSCEY